MKTILLALAVAALATGAQAKSCDRVCLTKLTDQTLVALMAGQTVPGARLTENGADVTSAAGGLTKAKTIKFRHYFASPKDGAAGFYGTADEGDRMAVFSVRLAVKNARVTEIETVITHKGEASLAAPEAMTAPKPVFDARPAKASSRAVMIAAAKAYFDGIEAESGDKVPAAPTCNRYENGVQTTNRPGAPQTGCRGLGGFAYIERVRDRRYVLADAERGLLWGLAVFDIPGGTYPALVGSGTIKREPRSILIAELFKLDGGQIQDIEVVMRNVPLGAGDGWSRTSPLARRETFGPSSAGEQTSGNRP